MNGNRHLLKSSSLLLCVLLTAAACNLVKVDVIEEQDLIGVWKEDSENCNNELPDCAWFKFSADGYFQARNISAEYFGYVRPYHFPSYAIFDATGEWKIELSSDPLGNHKIRIRFDPVSGMGYPVYNNVLYVSGNKGRFHLFGWHGDPSNRVTFIQVSAEDENK